jgi:hypothetical protein
MLSFVLMSSNRQPHVAEDRESPSAQQEAQGIKNASNSRPSPGSDARSYQHKAVGELHRQKAGMFPLLQSIDALVQELQVRLAAFQYVVLDGHCYQSIY